MSFFVGQTDDATSWPAGCRSCKCGGFIRETLLGGSFGILECSECSKPTVVVMSSS